MRLLLLLLALLAPLPALAQALQCVVPQRLPDWRAEGPTAREPRRMLPTASYTLAVSWSPGYCRTRSNRADARFQCGTDNRFGFVLHGLWPDGQGREWPQYCRAAPKLAASTIRQNLCVTPSAQLIQHEWAKHGTPTPISAARARCSKACASRTWPPSPAAPSSPPASSPAPWRGSIRA